MTPAVEIRGATKRFGAVLALDAVDLDVAYGEVVALLGDNGAGKSTLIKCLTGVHRLDSGTVRIDGDEVHIASPAAARSLGIETVYQDLALFDNLVPGGELPRRARDGATPVAARARCGSSTAGRWPTPRPRCSSACRCRCPIATPRWA